MIKELIIKKYGIEGTDRLFDTEKEALVEEKLLKQQDNIMQLLGGKIEDINFTRGEGMVKIRPELVHTAKEMFGDMLEDLFGKREVHPRILDDYSTSRIPNAIRVIFDCMFENGEFFYRVGQPYYAIHPNQLYSKEIIKEVI